MQQLASFLSGTWQSGRGRERTIHHAISGEALWSVTSEGLDMAAARRYAIERGGEALHAMTFIERAAMLKAVAKHLLSEKETFYALSAQTGSISKAASAPSSLTPAWAAASCWMTPCGRKTSRSRCRKRAALPRATF